MFYQGITKADVVNGRGVRVVLWVSGCSLHCKNCHNPETWERTSGSVFDRQAKINLFQALDKPYIQGLTLSGGHPLEEYNIKEIYDLIKEVKEIYPQKDIWLYTGFTWEMLMDEKINNEELSALYKSVIAMCDIIVDGPYIDELRDITLAWRGSSNQRIIDVKKSLEAGRAILANI